MNDKSEKDAAQEQDAGARPVTRFLIDEPEHGWRVLPLSRYLLIFDGHMNLPEHAGRKLRVATVQIELSATAPTKLTRLDCSEWIFDAEGCVDQQAVMKNILARLDGDETAAVNIPMTVDDISAIKRCLKIRGDPPD